MKELRCFVFNEQEVITAVIERRRRAREQLPIGTVKGITYDAGESQAVFANKYEVVARIAIVDDYGKSTELTAKTAELAAALIEYCLNRKIKMPRSSNKWVELIHLVDLTLLMTIDTMGKEKVVSPAIAKPAPISAARTRINAGTTNLVELIKTVAV